MDYPNQQPSSARNEGNNLGLAMVIGVGGVVGGRCVGLQNVGGGRRIIIANRNLRIGLIKNGTSD